jgi:hypothetical protein
MPRHPRIKDEDFRCAVESWSFDYGLFLNDRPRDVLGRCWESLYIVLRGRLLSKTRRRIERVELTLDPRGVEPESWKEGWRGFGSVSTVSRGTLQAFVHLPMHAFQAVFLAVVAGKLAGVEFVVRPNGRRLEGIRSFVSIDPSAPEDTP